MFCDQYSDSRLSAKNPESSNSTDAPRSDHSRCQGKPPSRRKCRCRRGIQQFSRSILSSASVEGSISRFTQCAVQALQTVFKPLPDPSSSVVYQAILCSGKDANGGRSVNLDHSYEIWRRIPTFPYGQRFREKRCSIDNRYDHRSSRVDKVIARPARLCRLLRYARRRKDSRRDERCRTAKAGKATHVLGHYRRAGSRFGQGAFLYRRADRRLELIPGRRDLAAHEDPRRVEGVDDDSETRRCIARSRAVRHWRASRLRRFKSTPVGPRLRRGSLEHPGAIVDQPLPDILAAVLAASFDSA